MAVARASSASRRVCCRPTTFFSLTRMSPRASAMLASSWACWRLDSSSAASRSARRLSVSSQRPSRRPLSSIQAERSAESRRSRPCSRDSSCPVSLALRACRSSMSAMVSLTRWPQESSSLSRASCSTRSCASRSHASRRRPSRRSAHLAEKPPQKSPALAMASRRWLCIPSPRAAVSLLSCRWSSSVRVASWPMSCSRRWR
mmetsp:Transcript_110724/g.238266  ORF Transcript_110724/g.238266 Transcript_110724/m.238266 type:complete len:202 (-) Transcript_110724:423-1028(-)